MEENKVDALGLTLRAEFDEMVTLRRPYEEEWVTSLRQYKGIYEYTTQEKMRSRDATGSSRSKIFMRLTKIKCDATKSRLMDLLFPANGMDNFELKPTPDPVVRDEAIQAGLQEFVAQGGDPNTLDMEQFRRDIADETCKAMVTAVRDQLAETDTRHSYRKTCDMVVSQAVRYGTGILKGPLVESRMKRGYAPGASGEWQMQEVEDGLWPFFEFVPIWSVYPDIVATDKKQLRFVWQEHLMTAKDLKGLTRMSSFHGDIIDEYLRSKPNGDASLRQYETEIRQLSEEYTAPDLKGRYRVLERWGYITGAELRQAGLPIGEDQDAEIFSSNIWIVGNSVIKAVLNPLQGVDFPYFFYHHSKDESSFFGDGVPKMMRDCQAGINAAIRAMVDNAAATAGPQIGINIRALAEGEDPRDISPWKVWAFDNADDMNQAMKVWTLPNISQDLRLVLEIFQNFADELTTPRYMYGDQKVGGAGSTASGLSMLMGAANISLKDLVKSFDEDVTIPFISAMYAWNMQWSQDPSVKGDYNVVATGSTSLMAKEIRAQQHQALIGVTSNPRFAGMTDDMAWLTQMFRDADMPEHIVRSEAEYKSWQQEQMAMQAKAQSDAMMQSAMEQAANAGLDPQAAIMHVLGTMAPQLAQGGGGEQPGQ